jgi:hypothetical protein
LSTLDVENVGHDDKFFESMDPMETIKKDLRKKTWNLLHWIDVNQYRRKNKDAYF